MSILSVVLIIAALSLAISFWLKKAFKLKIPVVRTSGKDRDSFLVFMIVALIFLAVWSATGEWSWLGASVVLFVCDLLLVSKKHYQNFASRLKASRNERMIAGSCIAVLLLLAVYWQWEVWSRQMILKTGIPTEGVLLERITGTQHDPTTLIISYDHPVIGSNQIKHQGFLNESANFLALGQKIKIHYDPKNSKKIAMDDYEQDILSFLCTMIFFGGFVGWYFLRLALPNIVVYKK